MLIFLAATGVGMAVGFGVCWPDRKGFSSWSKGATLRDAN